MKRRSMAWLLAALLVLTTACGEVTEGLGGEGEGGGEQQENEGGGEQENEGGGEEGGGD